MELAKNQDMCHNKTTNPHHRRMGDFHWARVSRGEMKPLCWATTSSPSTEEAPADAAVEMEKAAQQGVGFIQNADSRRCCHW